MFTRPVLLKKNKSILKCPKCGNNRRFEAHSDHCCEDSCDVWVVCKCGYDPTTELWGYRVESVMGSLDLNGVQEALLYSWNEALRELENRQAKNTPKVAENMLNKQGGDL